MSHSEYIYHTFEEYAVTFLDTPRAQRKARRFWKKHVKKYGNVPLILGNNSDRMLSMGIHEG
jgi:hypothetical protein